MNALKVFIQQQTRLCQNLRHSPKRKDTKLKVTLYIKFVGCILGFGVKFWAAVFYTQTYKQKKKKKKKNSQAVELTEFGV